MAGLIATVPYQLSCWKMATVNDAKNGECPANTSAGINWRPFRPSLGGATGRLRLGRNNFAPFLLLQNLPIGSMSGECCVRIKRDKPRCDAYAYIATPISPIWNLVEHNS